MTTPILPAQQCDNALAALQSLQSTINSPADDSEILEKAWSLKRQDAVIYSLRATTFSTPMTNRNYGACRRISSELWQVLNPKIDAIALRHFNAVNAFLVPRYVTTLTQEQIAQNLERFKKHAAEIAEFTSSEHVKKANDLISAYELAQQNPTPPFK
jgi:hypothetical protein